MAADGLGPLLARVPEALRASAPYHVPKPARVDVKLDANELPFALPDELRARLSAELGAVALERYPDPRAHRLRQLVSTSLGVTPAQLVFGNGSDELISMLCSAFPGPVLTPSPTFVYYRIAAIARGLPIVEVPTTARFEIDEDALARAIEAERPSIVFLALPNNPTGTLWRRDLAVELAARHRDTVIVSDEAYHAYSGYTNLGSLAAHPNLVVMRTLSKIGFAGLRVGFSISSTAIADTLEKVRPPYNVSALDQRAAEIALEHAITWSTERAAEVVAQRGVLARELAIRGLEVFASEANLILVRTPDAAAVWKRLADAGVAVRSFGSSGPLAGCLRITVGTATDNATLLSAL